MIIERTEIELEPRYLAVGDMVRFADQWHEVTHTQKIPRGWLTHLRAGDDERVVLFGIFARVSVKRWSQL